MGFLGGGVLECFVSLDKLNSARAFTPALVPKGVTRWLLRRVWSGIPHVFGIRTLRVRVFGIWRRMGK